MLQPVSPKNDLSPKRDMDQLQSRITFGVLAPFTIPVFRMIWLANLFANLGTWSQSVAAAWVVTEAQASAVVVAMIQVAASVPLVLLSILSGVLADNYDRRKIMLVGLSIEFGGAAFLCVTAFLKVLDPYLLIAAILWITLGSALVVPAWQAAVGEQVPRRLLGHAVILNSINFNTARAVGPALGGVMLSYFGASWVFLFNCCTYVALIVVLWRWHRDVPKRVLPPEHMLEGVMAAMRFTRNSSVTRLVMLRSFLFGLSASAIWALLPLLARQQPNADARVYGMMLGALGIGAIAGGILSGQMRKLLGSSRLISVAGVLSGLVLLTLGTASRLWILYLALVMGGIGWISAVATYNTSVQMLVPDWVKARALALYQTALFGGLAAGSFMWGHFAENQGVQMTLSMAGVMMLVFAAMLYSPAGLPELGPLGGSAGTARAESKPEPSGQPSFEFDPSRGAVMVTIDYRIPAERTRDFVRAVGELRRLRLRNGAERWSMYRDVDDKALWQEVLIVDNWLQHLRILDRLTIDDKHILDTVVCMHSDNGRPPVVHHGVSYESAARIEMSETATTGFTFSRRRLKPVVIAEAVQENSVAKSSVGGY